MPPYDELVIIANRARLDDPQLKAFVGAVERAVQFLINHPDEAWDLFKAYKDGLDDELNRRAWRDTLPRFALRPAALDRGRPLRQIRTQPTSQTEIQNGSTNPSAPR